MDTTYTFEYAEKLYKVIGELKDDYQETGLISGSKLGYAPLTAILRMIGVNSEFDDFTKGKFLRGHDLEYRLIGLLWGVPPAENEWYETKDGTRACWQYLPETSYRGTSVTIDLIEDVGEYYVIHEVKSSTKMAWDKTAGKGYSKWVATKKGETIKPELKPHHSIQAALQGLTPLDKPVKVMVHYLNADDYRIISFELDPLNFKEQIDNDINAILQAFATHTFPEYVPRWGWDKGKYNNYVDFEKLTSDQIKDKLRQEHKPALDKFMMSKLEGDNVIYSKETK